MAVAKQELPTSTENRELQIRQLNASTETVELEQVGVFLQHELNDASEAVAAARRIG